MASSRITKQQWAAAVDIDQLGKTKVECKSSKNSTQTYDGKTICFSTSNSEEYYTVDNGGYFLYSVSGGTTKRKTIDEATYQGAKDKFYGTFASRISFADLQWNSEKKAYNFDEFNSNNVCYANNYLYFESGSLTRWDFKILSDEGIESYTYTYSHPTDLSIALPNYTSPYTVSESNFQSALASSSFNNVTVIAKKMDYIGETIEEGTYKNSSSDGIFEGYHKLHGESTDHYYIDLNAKKYYGQSGSSGSYSCSDYSDEDTYISSLAKIFSKLSFSDFTYNDSSDRYEAEDVKVDDLTFSNVQLGFSNNKLSFFGYGNSSSYSYENKFCNYGKVALALPTINGDSHQVSQKQFSVALSASSFGNVRIDFDHTETNENDSSSEYIDSYITEDGLLQYVTISGDDSSQTYYDFANDIAYVYQGPSAYPTYKTRVASSSESQASKVASQLSVISYSQLTYNEDDGTYNYMTSGRSGVTFYTFCFTNQRLIRAEFETQFSSGDSFRDSIQRWAFSDYGCMGLTLPEV